MSHTFNVTWEVTVVVDAESEEEAWDYVHDAIDHAWSKSAGNKTIDLVDEPEEDDQWGRFDTDPDEESITNLAVDHSDLF